MYYHSEKVKSVKNIIREAKESVVKATEDYNVLKREHAKNRILLLLLLIASVLFDDKVVVLRKLERQSALQKQAHEQAEKSKYAEIEQKLSSKDEQIKNVLKERNSLLVSASC